jgi:hypothetical protein
MLAESQRALQSAARSGAPADLTDGVRARIEEALRDEFVYRERKKFLRANRRSDVDVDAYLARAARLKKHFEEVLFLDRETEQLDERVQQWMATLGALLGGIVAFVAIQVAVTQRRPGPMEVGWGLATLALIAGLGYAARQQMREWGRGWLAGKVLRFHAQRLSRCRVPSRRLPSKDTIVETREWCHQATTSRPDPLNPEAGASLRTTHVHYLHKGVVHPQEELSEAGVKSVRHIFRYDLSSLFPRLDDDRKLVPVLDGNGRVSVIEAMRKYRVRVDVRVTFGGERHEHKAEIVLDKNGLHSVVPDASVR